ncbi:hypothetical protein EON80_05715 [bacterium]|nr:MAG: hypothetical protein EON80_05715 [bacterium]
MQKIPFLLCAAASLWLIPAASAVDHNNIDSTRPLDFDDAESIAFREKAVEFGALLNNPKKGRVGFGGAEFLYGFAPNSHLSLDFDPAYASQQGSKRRLDAGDIGVGVFHNFNRELPGKAAFSVRADAYLPTGRGSSGVDVRLRGIASRRWHQYDRLHLNVDLGVNSGAASGERRLLPGVILGYSKPLGFPTRFDRTLVAQVGYRASQDRGQSGLLNVGIGLRQQVGVRSVFDIGVKNDLTGGDERALTLVAGYSRQF